MSKNYQESVEMADVIHDKGAFPEQLVALGYRAGLQDAVKALHESGAASPSSEGSRRLYAIMINKMGSRVRKFEARAKELNI